jgi:hypothetical protein
VCRAEVFARAAETARDAWIAALGGAADSLTLTLTGDALASDADADLRADALDAQLTGEAATAALVLPVVATLSASPSVEPSP